MTNDDPGRSGQRFVWTLTFGLFALGALSLFFSFGDSTNDGVTASGAGATADVPEGSNTEDGGSNDDNVAAGGDGTAATTDVAGTTASNRLTISVSGDILIHERVADAASTGDNLSLIHI